MSAARHFWSGRHSLPRPGSRHPAYAHLINAPTVFKLSFTTQFERQCMTARILEGAEKRRLDETRLSCWLPALYPCCSLEDVAMRAFKSARFTRPSFRLARLFEASDVALR